MAFLSGLDKDKKTVLYIGIAVLGLAIIIRVFAQKPNTTATDAASGAANATWLANFLATWNGLTGTTNMPGSAPPPTPAPTATSAPVGTPTGVPYGVAGAVVPTTGAAPMLGMVYATPSSGYSNVVVRPGALPQSAAPQMGAAGSNIALASTTGTAGAVKSGSIATGVAQRASSSVTSALRSIFAPSAKVYTPPPVPSSIRFGKGEGDDGSGGGEYGEGQGDYYGYGHRGGYGYGEGDDGSGAGEYGEGQGEYYGYGQMDAYGYGQGDDAIGAAMNIADFQSYSGYGRYGDASQLGGR